MGQDHQLKTAAGLSKLWDAAPLNRTRAGSPQATYRYRRGALHLMIQPGIAETVLRNEVLKDQSLLSLLLMAWPKSRIGLRLIGASDGEEPTRRAARGQLAVFQARLSDLLRHAPSTWASPLGLRPRLLQLDIEAREMPTDLTNQIEVAQAVDGPLAYITGFASKTAEQAARIAGVLTVFDAPQARCVPLQALGSAIRITTWYVTEAQRLMDAGTVHPDIEKAQLLLDFFWRRYPDVRFDKRAIVRFGPSSKRDAATAEKQLVILGSCGHIQSRTGPRLINGTNAKINWGLAGPSCIRSLSFAPPTPMAKLKLRAAPWTVSPSPLTRHPAIWVVFLIDQGAERYVALNPLCESGSAHLLCCRLVSRTCKAVSYSDRATRTRPLISSCVKRVVAVRGYLRKGTLSINDIVLRIQMESRDCRCKHVGLFFENGHCGGGLFQHGGVVLCRCVGTCRRRVDVRYRHGLFA